MSDTEGRTPKLDSYEQRGEGHPDVQKLHGPIYREKLEPEDGYQPVPTRLILMMFALLMWGGWYLGQFSVDFDSSVLDGPAAFVRGAGSGEPTIKAPLDPMAVGKRVFNNCIACHAANGLGVPGQYPPLVGSEWVLGDEKVLVRILLHGMQGPVVVLGETYNGQMPAWQQLSDAEIAGVLSYIRGSWGNTAAPVTAELVGEIRKIESRTQPWKAEELASLANQSTGDDVGNDAADEEVSDEDSPPSRDSAEDRS